MTKNEVSEDPEFPDRFMVVKGRRWRKADPTIPDDVRATLLSHLGRGRSGVRNASEADRPSHRRRVDLAKHGLGERGTPWWEQSPKQRESRWNEAVEALASLDDSAQE